MQDYSNSKKSKQVSPNPKPAVDLGLEKLVEGKLVVQKKSIGTKAKNVFVGVDFKGLAWHVVKDNLFPDIRNMVFDASNEVLKRLIYPNGIKRGGRTLSNASHFTTYGGIVKRAYTEPRELGPGLSTQSAPGPTQGPRAVSGRDEDTLYLVPTREDAEGVLEMMNAITQEYDIVSVHALKEILGIDRSHVDEKWGWAGVIDAEIRGTRDGYLMDFPIPEALT